MSTIDLIVLGMIKEKEQSAYDLQKNVEHRNISKWVKVSTPVVSVSNSCIVLVSYTYVSGVDTLEGTRWGFCNNRVVRLPMFLLCPQLAGREKQ